jgi:hypothetical protein
MNFSFKMKVENLFLEGEGCRATLRTLAGQYGSDYEAGGTVQVVIHRPKKMQGLLTLGEIYDVTFTPAPEKPDA